jgi:hypothetical protein
MIKLIIGILICFPATIFAQKKVFKEYEGLSAYYFWEEDSAGNIVKSTFDFPFLKNFEIRIDSESGKMWAPELKQKELQGYIAEFAEENKGNRKRKRGNSKNEEYKILLRKTASNYASTLIYTKKKSDWTSRSRQNVLYFNIDENKNLRFSHASDSLILSTLNERYKTTNHYHVFNYVSNSDGRIEKQEVFNNKGIEISESFESTTILDSERNLVFANGYRGHKKNKDATDNFVTSFDRYKYWHELDDSIIARLEPDRTFYIDGSMGVNTSSHRSKVKFGISYILARVFRNSKRFNWILNSKENEVGFETRKEQGRIAGRNFLNAICKSPVCECTKDTVDLVCHSMGYAYMLGFCEEIKEKVYFGKLYILAPESACVDGMDWSLFEEVWQYGSHDEGVPLKQMDVIAPQCMVKGLDMLPPEKGGRIYLPEDIEFERIEHLHDTKYFNWILHSIPENSPGYICRN